MNKWDIIILKYFFQKMFRVNSAIYLVGFYRALLVIIESN